MYKFILIFLFLYCFIFTANAQQETGEGRGRLTDAISVYERISVAPINWQRYKISDDKISIMLPKLPIHYQINNSCFEEVEKKYAVYANGIVYGFNVISKMNETTNESDCPNRTEFNASSFLTRLTEVKMIYKAVDDGQVEIGNHKFIKLKSENSNFWFLNDYDNKRWVELWTSGERANSDKINDFLKSLELDSDGKAIEIGAGSSYTLGDEKQTNNIQLSPENTSTRTIKIAFKPPARYTDLARKNQTQGSCTLRVNFLANGSVGSISVVSALPNGLTEQSIEAAKKIVFVPAVKNGVFYNVTRQVQYNFKLY